MTSAWQIQQIALKVRDGAVIAYPTEAVWGLGCDPFNATAVARLLALKERPVHKGLILVAADIEQFAELLEGLSASELAQLQNWVRGYGSYVLLLSSPLGKTIASLAAKQKNRADTFDAVDFPARFAEANPDRAPLF